MSTKTETSWAIIGTRPNGEVLYYVSDSNGVKFVPNAHSLAFVWRKRHVALMEVDNMSKAYRGLTVSLEARP